MADKKMTGREVLEEAMRQYDQSYCEAFPPCEDEIDLGADYRSRMDKLMRRSKHRFWHSLYKIGGYVAVLALVIGIAFASPTVLHGEHKLTSTLYSHTTVGDRTITWFKFLPDTDGAPKYLETLFAPTYVPEGFVLVEQETYRYYKEYLFYVFENADGDRIYFTQETISHGVGYDPTIRTIEILQVHDFEVVYVSGGEGNIDLFWSNHGYAFQLEVPNTFSKEECIKILDFVQKVRE